MRAVRPEERASYTLFETAFGPCGVAWSASGITRLQLPEVDLQAARVRLERAGCKPASQGPAAVSEAVTLLQGYFAGAAACLDGIELDLEGVSAFHRRVYVAAQAVGRGRTVTYGHLAASVGEPGAARAVGQAMGSNPIPVIIPCHRVVAASGKLGSFSAYGGAVTKQRLLALEGGAAGDLPLLAGRI